MKIIKYISISFFSLLLYTGCEDLEELFFEEVEVTRSFTSTVSVDVGQETDPEMDVSFSESTGINLFANLEVGGIAISKDQIKKIEMQSVKYEYKNFSGNVDANITSRFRFGTDFATGSTQTFNASVVNVAESDLFNTEYQLSGDFSQVNEYLTNNLIVAYIYSGTVSDNPATFDVRLTVSVKMTVSVPIDNEEN